MEIVGKKWRTTFGILYQSFFTLGFMILGGVAYNWRDWHDMMVRSLDYIFANTYALRQKCAICFAGETISNLLNM